MHSPATVTEAPAYARAAKRLQRAVTPEEVLAFQLRIAQQTDSCTHALGELPQPREKKPEEEPGKTPAKTKALNP